VAPSVDTWFQGRSRMSLVPVAQVLGLSGPLYDGLYEYLKRGALLGREPA
jgi:hypothetical protein